MRLRNEEVPASVGVVNHVIGPDNNGLGVAVSLADARGCDSSEDQGAPLWKRILDITCIVLALPVLLPVMGAIALIIFCVSPGSVLYLQERVGYRGRRFVCFKFRTMKAGADVSVHRQHLADLMQSDRPMVKMDSTGDPRLIPLGTVLRATGLDELPQLLNVLGGQMSLVGPRPCVPYEYENYLPDQKRRFDTLPGLTGLWQVSGKNKTTFSEMIALDIRYAETKSLRLDLKIMARTLPALITQVKETRAKRRAEALLPRAVVVATHPSLAQAVPSERQEPVHRVRSAANLVEHE
jgi:lipopolysaccharide/colanic/teichoic acid biosynthesis glycosyltransferase